MKKTARWLPMLAALLLVGAGRKEGDDRITRHPDLERRRPSGVAILPAVAYQDLPGPESVVEQTWLAQFASSGHDWLPASMSREFLAGASRKPDSLMRLISVQLRNKGRIDSVAVRAVLRRLRRGALLWLRLDRWERDAPYSSGSVTVAHVEITAALVDSNGVVLWQASARERQEARYGIPFFAAGRPEWASGRDPGPEPAPGPEVWADGSHRSKPEHPGTITTRSNAPIGRSVTSLELTGADFEQALQRILARWRVSFPATRPISTSRPGG